MGTFWRKKHNNNNRRYGIPKDREKLGNLLENTNWYNAEYMLAVVQCLLQLLWTIRFLNWRWANTALKQKPFKNHAKRFKDNRDMHLFFRRNFIYTHQNRYIYKLNATATNQSWSLHMFFFRQHFIARYQQKTDRNDVVNFGAKCLSLPPKFIQNLEIT